MEFFLVMLHGHFKMKWNMHTYYNDVAISIISYITCMLTLQNRLACSFAFGLALGFSFVYHSYWKRNTNIDLTFKTVL